jgi:hypothetical protein
MTMPLWRSQRRRWGNKVDVLHNFLLDTLVGCLMSVGWSKQQSCGFITWVLVYCFGHTNPRIQAPYDASLALEDALVWQTKGRKGEAKRQLPSTPLILSSHYLIYMTDCPE